MPEPQRKILAPPRREFVVVRLAPNGKMNLRSFKELSISRTSAACPYDCPDWVPSFPTRIELVQHVVWFAHHRFFRFDRLLHRRHTGSNCQNDCLWRLHAPILPIVPASCEYRHEQRCDATLGLVLSEKCFGQMRVPLLLQNKPIHQVRCKLIDAVKHPCLLEGPNLLRQQVLRTFQHLTAPLPARKRLNHLLVWDHLDVCIPTG